MGVWREVADQNPLIELVRKPGLQLRWSRIRDRLPAPVIFVSMKLHGCCDHGEVAFGVNRVEGAKQPERFILTGGSPCRQRNFPRLELREVRRRISALQDGG